MNKSHHALSWMCFCGYFTWSNGSHCEVILIILILGVIFTHNPCIWPPGMIVWKPPYCFAIHFEEISSCFVLNVFLWLHCLIKRFKLWSYLHIINICGRFGVFEPLGWSYMGFPHTVLPLILKNPIMLWPECRLWWLCIIKWFKLSSYLPNTYSRGPFWLNFGHLIPHIYVPINIIIRRCCAIIFNEIPHALP